MTILRRCAIMAASAAVLVLMLWVPAAGQGTLGRLAGTVLDTSGGVLPGATVTLTNTQTNQVQATVTNETGGFLFPQLQVGNYKVTIELPGFKTASFPNVVINVNQEYSLTAKLEIGDVTETVIVEASSQLVQTTTPEISRTVVQQQVLQLPLLNRDMTNLIKMQAGVPGILTRVNTGVSGGRATWTQVTQDGINVQDNFIRTNSLDFLPNRPTSDNVAEFTITTSVQGADAAGGATAVRMVTPSGNNKFRGSAFEQNRDNRFAANSFFNNRSKLPKPLLQQNQYGGSVGGPIQRDRLFFYSFYEGFNRKQAGAQNATIPAYPDTFQGIWRYMGLDGQMHSINILQATGSTIDPKVQSDILAKIPDSTHVNNYDRGDSKANLVKNTAAYRWNQNRLTKRNYIGGRVDFELNPRNHFEAVGSFFKETDDRPDLDLISPDKPLAFTSAPVKRMVGAWRWAPSGKLQNEVRIGANLAPVKFEVTEGANPILRFAGQNLNLPLTLMNPQISFFPQGRYTNTYQFNDNASWMLGTHAMQFGASLQRIHVNPYNFEGTVPTVTFGFSTAAPGSAQLTDNMFPGGISAADRASANSMLSILTGTVSQVTRTFQVQDQSSGYVSGIPNNRNYSLNNWSAYVQDSWRWKPNLTLRGGLKWEYYSPVREDNNLAFLPVVNNRTYADVLADPTATVTFVDGQMWKPDRANFGPTVGFNYDPFRDGKTSIRGGYSLTFVNEEGVTVATNLANFNAGLATANALQNLYTRLNTVPEIPTPTFKTVRTLPDQMALSATGSMGLVNPKIQQPRVHQVSIGVSREIFWNLAAEARYVGTFGRDIWKGIDMNQVTIPQAFLDDFNHARSNGYLALSATGKFDPAYNPNVAGSVPLTVLPSYGGGFFTNATVTTALQQNEVAGLADFYVTSRVAGALAQFYPQNGAIYQANVTLNDGWQDYNALQLELRRPYRNGFMAQVNYTYSRNRSNSAGGASQSRFEPYLDINRKNLDAGRSAYDIPHIVNFNAIYDLPFGRGKRWVNQGGWVNAIVGDWQLSTIGHWQSGSPVGIYSTRGTFNRANRSAANTAYTTLSVDQIKSLFKVTKMPDGRIFWIDPTLVGSDGRAVGADNLNNAAGFTGQVFFNPTAGQVGSLPILAFMAPAVWQLDASLAKRVRFGGSYNLEFRAEAFNLTNSVSFYTGDFNINSTTFGQLTQVGNTARIVQFTVRFSF